MIIQSKFCQICKRNNVNLSQWCRPMTAWQGTNQRTATFYPSITPFQQQKSAQRRQKLRADCSKAKPKIFAPPQTPFPRARDGQNLISWRQSLPLPTKQVWWGSMHANSSYPGNRPTHTHIHPQTHPQTGPITIHYTAPQLARSVTNVLTIVSST